MKRKQLLILLVLLMTVATGAWAQDAKHRITATLNFNSQTMQKTLDVTLPYATTIGAVYTAITDGATVSGLSLTSAQVKSGSNVSIGAFNGWETPVNATADGNATVGFTATLMGAEINGTITLRVASPYEVKLADGTQDAGNWTATVGQVADQELPANVFKGDAVTLTYGGRLKVKAVNATHDGWNGDLSNIPASALEADGQTLIVPNGATLKGELDVSTIPYKVVIPAGATVTLDNATINGVHNTSYKWAGITCAGNATIVLKDGTTNTVRGFFMTYPGIHVPEGSTLTITGGKEGNGKLTATSNGYGAGIGGGEAKSCGNITITGGDITATGGVGCAGIGGGNGAICGDITITGGTVTAAGGPDAAGIGGGVISICGNITITDGVTRVTASKSDYAPHSIGAGNGGTCGTVTIGGTVYWQDNAALNDGDTYLGQATIVYPEPAVTWNTVDLSTLTADYEAQDGDKLTGTLSGDKKISIADGATVMLDGAVINGTNSSKWAGLTLAGDGTIILSGENSVKGFYEDYPGIFVPVNKTLTIQGDGSLTASSNGYGAGIGGGYEIACGNITIEGGTVSATGGRFAAGIGGGSSTSCGAISITGGTVTASGGQSSPGIGSGSSTSCGAVTIANTVTSVTATKGENATISIGASYNGSCGTVTIGGTKYWENNAAVNGGNTYLAQSPLIYAPSN